jgi:hypothetical protein
VFHGRPIEKDKDVESHTCAVGGDRLNTLYNWADFLPLIHMCRRNPVMIIEFRDSKPYMSQKSSVIMNVCTNETWWTYLNAAVTAVFLQTHQYASDVYIAIHIKAKFNEH